MARWIYKEKGSAYLMVLLFLIIISATIVAVSAGLRTQSNVSVMSRNGSTGLMSAENGLAIAQAVIKKSGVAAIGSQFVINTPDGWRVNVTYNSTTNQLTASAQNGRYQRAVAMNVGTVTVAGGGPLPTVQTNKAVFTNGNITVKHGGCNLKKDIPCFANANVTIENGVDHLSNTTFQAGGMCDNQSNQKNENQYSAANGQTKLPFPEIDWNAFKNAQGITTLNTTQLNSSNLSVGGIIYVPVSSSDIYISGDITLAKETTLVFVKTNGYTGGYTVHLQTGNINGCDEQRRNDGTIRRLNILSDTGLISFEQKANFNNPSGLIYTGADNYSIQGNVNAAVFADNSTNFKVASIISRGDVYFKNANFDYGSYAPDWSSINGLNNIWNTGATTQITFTNWREL